MTTQQAYFTLAGWLKGLANKGGTGVVDRVDARALGRASDAITRLQADNERLQQWVNDLQAKMYINCVYCGHRYGPDSEVPATMSEVLKLHIEQCPKHPMSELRRENERLLLISVAAKALLDYTDALIPKITSHELEDLRRLLPDVPSCEACGDTGTLDGDNPCTFCPETTKGNDCPHDHTARVEGHLVCFLCDTEVTETTKDSDSLPCCGSEGGVHLIGCQSEDALAGRIHRPPEKDSNRACPKCGYIGFTRIDYAQDIRQCDSCFHVWPPGEKDSD